MRHGIHLPHQRVERHLTRRILTYAAGLFLAAISTNLTIMANLGNSAVTSFCVVYSTKIGMELGDFLTVVNLLTMVLELLVLRRDFQLINLAQVPFTFLYGQFVNIAGWMLPDIILTQWYFQVPLLLLALVLMALGILMFVSTELVPMPMEGLCLAVSAKTPIAFHNAKTSLDCIYLVAAIIFSFVFFGKLVAIGFGTIVLALGTGTTMGFIKPLLPRWLQSWHLT